ncbi:hypothetical protein ScPMuIL_003967 [Solemya velum]
MKYAAGFLIAILVAGVASEFAAVNICKTMKRTCDSLCRMKPRPYCLTGCLVKKVACMNRVKEFLKTM